MRLWLRAARRPRAGLERGALPSGGRSSLEMSAEERIYYLGRRFNGLPPYHTAVLAVLEDLSVYSPVVSQAVKLLASTVNCGHELMLEGPARQVRRARELLGELAPRLYRRSAGVDGLINQYVRQLAVTGALSSEDVLEPDLSGLREIVLVPARSIRWELEGGQWRPYQSTGSRRVPLNPITYAYYALETLEGHPPYGMPPFAAVIEPEALQREILEHLKFYAQKLGLYGITTISVPPPPRQPGESEAEYQQRCQATIDAAAEAYGRIYRDGLLVIPGGEQGHKVEHKDIAKSAGSVGEIVQGVEQLMMSALGIDPAMFGRSFSTTETYAGVVYRLLLRAAAQYQRLIKRRMERTYRLALLLAGLTEVRVNLVWNPQPSLNPQDDARAEQVRTETVLTKARAGIIDADQAAQELGYKHAADPLRIAPEASGAAAKTVRMALASDGRGGYRPPSLGWLGRFSAPGDEEDEDLRAERAVAAEAAEQAARYREGLSNISRPILARAMEAVEELLAEVPALDEEEFVGRVMEVLAREHGRGWATEQARRAVRREIETVYRQVRLLSDLAGIGRHQWTWGAPEQRVLDFAVRADQFYCGRFLDTPQARARAMRFLREQYLIKGAGLFGRQDPEVLAAFRREMEQELRVLTDSHLAMIADTSIMRLRNWAAVHQMREAGARYAQVWAVLDARTSEICREMHGRIIPLDALVDEVDHLSGLSAEEFELHIKLHGSPSAKDVRLEGLGRLKAARSLAPPYHPRCRTRLKVSLEPAPQAGEPPEGLNRAQQRAWRYWHELPPEARRMHLRDAQQGEFHNDRLLRSHAHAHSEVAADVDGYRQALAEVLADPERVLVRLDSAGNLQLGLVRGGRDDWRLAIVDLVARTPNGVARVRTLYGPSLKKHLSWDDKRQSLGDGGWVEVEK